MNLHRHRHSYHQSLRDAAQTPARDPTGTTQLRLRFRADAQRRLSTLRSATHAMLVERDALGHRAIAGIDIFKLPHDPGHLVDEFMRWFAAGANSQLVDSNWWIPHLERAFNSGITAGSKLLKREQFMPLALPAAYGTQVERELDGLVAALVQQVSRVLAQGALQKTKAPILYRQVLSAIKKVGVTRLNALANSQVVLLHNVGRLAIFDQLGVQQVGTIPERLPVLARNSHRAVRTRDAQFSDRTREEIATAAAERRVLELLERQRAAAEREAAQAEVELRRAQATLETEVAKQLAGTAAETTKAAARAELKVAQAAAQAEVAAAKAATAAREVEAKSAWETVKQARRAERLAMTPEARAAERGFQIRTPPPSALPRPAGYEAVAKELFGLPSLPERLTKIGSEYLNVLTAGDDRVCPICIALSEEGPYSLLEAWGMLPAHVDCRCAFVPAFSTRNQELAADIE